MFVKVKLVINPHTQIFNISGWSDDIAIKCQVFIDFVRALFFLSKDEHCCLLWAEGEAPVSGPSDCLVDGKLFLAHNGAQDNPCLQEAEVVSSERPTILWAKYSAE
jgi:hypothetical protein